MVKFYYVENKYVKEFLRRGYSGEYVLGHTPELFPTRVAAFKAYEDYRGYTKAMGKLVPSLEIKDIEL